MSSTEYITSLNQFNGKAGTFFYNKDHLFLLKNDSSVQTIDINHNFTSILVDADENLILTNYSGTIYIYKNDNISEYFNFSENIRRVFHLNQTNFLFSDEDYKLYKSTNFKTQKIYSNTERRIVDDKLFASYPDIFFNHKCFTNWVENKKQGNNIIFDTLTIKGQMVYFGTGYADIKAISNNKSYSIFTDYIDDNSRVYSTITGLKIVNNNLYFTTIFGLNSIDFSERKLDKLYKKKRITIDNHTSHLRRFNGQLIYIDNKVDLIYFNTDNSQHKSLLKGVEFNISSVNDVETSGDSLIILACNNGIFELKFNRSNTSVKSIHCVNFTNNTYLESISDVNFFEDKYYFTSLNKIYVRHLGTEVNGNQHSGKLIFTISNSNLQLDSNTQTYSIAGNDRNIRLKYFIPTFNVINTFNHVKTLFIKDGDTLETLYPDGNFVNFDNLAVGDYKIIFFYRDHRNQYIPSKVFKIQIIPFYFETAYFRMILLSLFLFVIVMIIGFINMRLKNRLMSFENENYNMKLLKAQLRPHFLYNTLNTLKSIVYHQKNDLALELIDKFTLFLRHNLSVDNVLVNTLQSEIKEIENYIEIENLRTNNKIELNYNIKNLGLYNMPSNIIQPIVENAILHGLIDKEKLHISIQVSESKSYFTLFIRNDGKPIVFNDNKSKSFAIQSIKTRLEIFNKKKIKSCFILHNTTLDNKSIVEYVVKIRKYKL